MSDNLWDRIQQAGKGTKYPHVPPKLKCHMNKMPLLCLFIVVVSLSAATTAYAQGTPPTAETANTVAGLPSWLALILAFFGGAVGGIVFELLALQGRIELPHWPSADEIKTDMTEDGSFAVAPFVYDLGILARVLIGAVAAVIALIVFVPANLIQLLGVAAVAGSAGTSVFRTIQDRLLATLGQRDAALARAQTAKLEAINERITQKVDTMETALKATMAAPQARDLGPEGAAGAAPLAAAGTTISSVPASAMLDLVNDVQRLLSEAKGMGSAP